MVLVLFLSSPFFQKIHSGNSLKACYQDVSRSSSKYQENMFTRGENKYVPRHSLNLEL